MHERKGLSSNENTQKVVEGFPGDAVMSHDVLGEWKFIR